VGRTKARTTTDTPTLSARIDRAIYRLRNTNGLPLRPVGDYYFATKISLLRSNSRDTGMGWRSFQSHKARLTTA
jgi:hypothetical protein